MLSALPMLSALAPQLHLAEHQQLPAHYCSCQGTAELQVVKGPGWAYVVQLTAVGGLAFAHSPAAASPTLVPSSPTYPRSCREPALAVRTSAWQSQAPSSSVPKPPAEEDGAGQSLGVDGLPEQMQGEAQPWPGTH